MLVKWKRLSMPKAAGERYKYFHFLWTGIKEKEGIALLKWKRLSKPYAAGGWELKIEIHSPFWQGPGFQEFVEFISVRFVAECYRAEILGSTFLLRMGHIISKVLSQMFHLSGRH